MEDSTRAALRAPRDESSVAQAIEGLTLSGAGGGDGGGDHGPTHPKPPLPPPSRIVSSGVVMTDITDRFIAAASTLEPGDLVKDGYFTLFEAVGALEIMDPKMDSGCVESDDTDTDYQVAGALSAANVIGIMDQLLCLEMAWHQGYPLSQTLLTSLHMTGILIPTPRSLDDADYLRDRDSSSMAGAPPLPEHVVLRAYCVALVSAMGRIITRVRDEVYFEEEDLATNTYGLAFLEETSTEEIRQVLNEARATVADGGHGWSAEIMEALLARLDFRESFLTAMEVSEVRAQPESLRALWAQMTAALPKIKASHGLGVAVPAAFNTKMQGMLASTMPPRPIVQPSFDESLENWTRLSEDAGEAVLILNYEDPQSMLTFLAKKPQPQVYIRTFVQSLLFFENVMLGAHSIRQILDDDLAIVVLPASRLLDPVNDAVEATHDPRFTIARLMERFRQRSFSAYLEIYRTLCQNRSRARRMMCHLVREWDLLQADAEEIDAQVQAAVDELAGPSTSTTTSDGAQALPLSSWAFLYKLRIMEWVVQLGFELQIYQADELAGMYWYLSYLAKQRVQHAERIRTFTLRSLQEQQKKYHGGGGALPTHVEAAFSKSLLYLRATMLDASVTWELADALSCLYTALHRTGVLQAPPRPYSHAQWRHEVRTKPFATVALPELPPFATFRAEAEQAGTSVAAVLQYAEQALGGAKKGCEALTRFDAQAAFAAHCHGRWVAGTKSMHKSAIFAGLALTMLKKEVDRVGGEVGGTDGTGADGTWPPLKLTASVPTPDQCYHEWWIVPKLTGA